MYKKIPIIIYGFEKYIEDITCPRVDMNFMFECSTRSLRSFVRYRVEHEKINFVSTSGRAGM